MCLWEKYSFVRLRQIAITVGVREQTKWQESKWRAHLRFMLPWIVARSRKSYLANCPMRLSWSAVITCSRNSVYTVRKSALSAWGNCIKQLQS